MKSTNPTRTWAGAHLFCLCVVLALVFVGIAPRGRRPLRLSAPPPLRVSEPGPIICQRFAHDAPGIFSLRHLYDGFWHGDMFDPGHRIPTFHSRIKFDRYEQTGRDVRVLVQIDEPDYRDVTTVPTAQGRRWEDFEPDEVIMMTIPVEGDTYYYVQSRAGVIDWVFLDPARSAAP